MSLCYLTENAQAVGTDLMDGNRFATSGLPRRVTRIGCGGSAAIGDAVYDLFYGSELIARFTNTSTDDCPNGQDMFVNPGVKVCAPNDPIRIIVADASGSATGIVLEIEELPPVVSRGTYGRGYGRRF